MEHPEACLARTWDRADQVEARQQPAVLGRVDELQPDPVDGQANERREALGSLVVTHRHALELLEPIHKFFGPVPEPVQFTFEQRWLLALRVCRDDRQNAPQQGIAGTIGIVAGATRYY
jgi:hypothetical protein